MANNDDVPKRVAAIPEQAKERPVSDRIQEPPTHLNASHHSVREASGISGERDQHAVSEDKEAEGHNVVEHVSEKERRGTSRNAQLGMERDTLEREQRALDQLGQRAESKRVGVENLSEKARELDQAHDQAEQTGEPADRSDQLAAEREKNRQIALMEQVHSQFRVAGSRYHFKDQPAKIAFKDQGHRMVSASNDDRVAHAMATMADAKGWKTIKVSGHPEFVREVWMQASLRGLEVRGYKPTEQDKELLDALRDRAMHNSVEHDPQRGRKAHAHDAGAEQMRTVQERGKGTDRTEPLAPREKAATGPQRALAGQLLAHSAARYQYDPEADMSYFVKLKDNQGERTVWGVDLKRAIAASKARTGDQISLEYKGAELVKVNAPKRDKEGRVIGQQEIEANRNTWSVKKSERYQVAEAVASALIDAGVTNKAQRDALKAAVSARLAERDRTGKVPVVAVYDRSVPSRTRERAAPVVERNVERTRSR